MRRHNPLLPLLATLFHHPLPVTSSHLWGEEALELTSSGWSESLSRPNASSTLPIPAYNLSERYPGSESSDDWSLTLRIRANVPVNETRDDDHDQDVPDDEAFFTATEVSYRPPEEYRDLISGNGTHPTWALCQHFFRSVKLKSSEGGRVSGDCSDVLSEDCRRDLMLQLRADFGRKDDDDDDDDEEEEDDDESDDNGKKDDEGKNRDKAGDDICSTAQNSLPASCLDDMREGSGGPSETADEEQRYDFVTGSSAFSLTPGDTEYGVRFGHLNHSSRDFDAYDKAIRQIWVAAFIWGPRNASVTRSNETTVDGIPDEAGLPNGTLSCIRADDIAEGSRDLEDGAVPAYGMARGQAWAALAMAAGAVAVML